MVLRGNENLLKKTLSLRIELHHHRKRRKKAFLLFLEIDIRSSQQSPKEVIDGQ